MMLAPRLDGSLVSLSVTKPKERSWLERPLDGLTARWTAIAILSDGRVLIRYFDTWHEADAAARTGDWTGWKAQDCE